MIRPKAFFSVFAFVLGLAVMPAAWAASEADVNAEIDKLLGHHALYETAVRTFQQAVIDGHKEDAAAFVRYPIRVEVDGRMRVIWSSAAFIAHYAGIMTPDVIKAVTEQKYEDLVVDREGIMIGQGEVWFDGFCLDRRCRTFVPKVVTIQHPDEP